MPSITGQTIRDAVTELGLAGQAVCLHASLRSFGHVEGGPETVVRAFLDEECTILVPTFTDDFSIAPPAHLRPKQNGCDYGGLTSPRRGQNRQYDSATNEITREDMGAVAAWLLEQPGRIRGNHPLCSFTALGPLADELVGGQTRDDVFFPLRRLGKNNGSVILMGVGLERATILHAAEELAGRRSFVRWANDETGRPGAVRVGGCSDGFERLRPFLSHLEKTQRVGASLWRIYPARGILAKGGEVIRHEPEMTRCHRPQCERCRDAMLGGPFDLADQGGKDASTRLSA